MLPLLNHRHLKKQDFSRRALGNSLSGLFFFLVATCLTGIINPLGSRASEGSPISESDLSSIIEKSLQAYGDKEHLLVFANSSQFIGTISSQNDNWQKHAYKCTRKSPSWRRDIDHALNNETNQIESTIFDGTAYWQLIGVPSTKISANKESEQSDEMPPAAPSTKGYTQAEAKVATNDQSRWLADEVQREPFLLTNWQNPAYQFRLLGRGSYRQIPAYSIEVTDNKNNVTTIYIDCSNYLVLAMTFQSWPVLDTSSEPKKVTVTKEYSENRPVLGSIWPFKETLLVNREPVSICEFSTVKSADSVSPDYLKPPTSQNEVSQFASYARLTAPVQVPFEYHQKEILCRGKIENIEPLWFLIDTGASDTIIDRSFAAQCLLPRGSNYQISSFRGNIQSQTTKIERLELGPLIVNDVPAQIADLSSQSKQVGRSIAGIVGMNVLANYLLTIDYSSPCLTFADTYSGVRPEDASSIPFAQITNNSAGLLNGPPTPRIKATLPGGDANILLMDTGAAFNHLSAPIAIRHLYQNLEKSTHTLEATGLDGRPVQLGLITLDPIIIGSYKVHKVKFTYPIESANSKPKDGLVWQSAKLGSDVLSKDLDITGILGNPFFEHFLVTIDCSFHRLLLKPNPQFEITYELDQALAAGDTALYTKRDFRQAEFAYQKALMLADSAHNLRYQALSQGRMGNLRRVMSHDLKRPEHAQMSYQYFKKADEIASKEDDLKDVEGRILADWSLLYSENGQIPEAQQTMQKAILLAPKDAVVNVDYAVHLFRDRLYSEAQKYINKALFYDPANWQALWYQVKLSEMFQDLAKERATLKEIVSRYPSSKVAENKLKGLGDNNSTTSTNH